MIFIGYEDTKRKFENNFTTMKEIGIFSYQLYPVLKDEFSWRSEEFLFQIIPEKLKSIVLEMT